MIPGLAFVVRRLQARGFGSIFIKNLALLSVLIVLPIALVAGISALSFSAYAKSETTAYGFKSMRGYQTLTDAMISDYMAQADYLSNDEDIQLFLLHRPGEPVYYDRSAIHDLIGAQMSIKDYLESIYIYSNRSERLISNFGELAYDGFFDHTWLDEYLVNEVPSRFWCTLRTGLDSRNRSVPLLSIYKALGTTTDDQGVIVFNISFARFASQFEPFRGDYDRSLILADDSQRVLADIWGTAQTPLPDAARDKLAAAAEYGGYAEHGKLVYYQAPVRNTSWHYVLAVSKSIYRDSLGRLRLALLSVAAAWLLVTVLVAVLISLRIYRPIRSILGTLEERASPAESRPLPRDEEAFIVQSIRRTLHEHNRISGQLAERIRMLKRAQAIALQSQINPHFLHNTLDTINWSAMRLTGGKNETSVMLGRLAATLRYSLDDAGTLVTLEEELQHMRAYLELQTMRYRDKFSVEWDIAEEARTCRVIRLMLQPVVENAIDHGIKPLERKGLIRIAAARAGDGLEIAVRDDGVGMSRAQAARLNAMLRRDDIQEKAHIGLPNVSQRIRLLFGADYGVTVYAVEGRGADVRIRLPWLPESER